MSKDGKNKKSKKKEMKHVKSEKNLNHKNGAGTALRESASKPSRAHSASDSAACAER